jgi:hypothetical protein
MAAFEKDGAEHRADIAVRTRDQNFHEKAAPLLWRHRARAASGPSDCRWHKKAAD